MHSEIVLAQGKDQLAIADFECLGRREGIADFEERRPALVSCNTRTALEVRVHFAGGCVATFEADGTAAREGRTMSFRFRNSHILRFLHIITRTDKTRMVLISKAGLGKGRG